eukprot:TRINITY_DN1176_c0_g1_i1.p1 TRINITY_DN1176_c0_g1~~TRINITY_DN1176_c0_g1_i1.p1  ORF type:complete len:381 (-),score=66.39 TRINITY_DN1176_c0_g1_i1:69-1211(-)
MSDKLANEKKTTSKSEGKEANPHSKSCSVHKKHKHSSDRKRRSSKTNTSEPDKKGSERRSRKKDKDGNVVKKKESKKTAKDKSDTADTKTTNSKKETKKADSKKETKKTDSKKETKKTDSKKETETTDITTKDDENGIEETTLSPTNMSKKPSKKSLLAHRVKNNVASLASSPLFKHYMPEEIQQLLDHLVILLSRYAVSEKVGKKMKQTIVKTLVELFVMFDGGMVPQDDFRPIYIMFRRVCSLCKNTYLSKQASKTNIRSSLVVRTKRGLSRGLSEADTNKTKIKRSPKKRRKSQEEEAEESQGDIEDKAYARIVELVQKMSDEVMSIVTPLKMKKVNVKDLKAIFDAVTQIKFVKACFEDVIFPKIVVILADFLENY